MFASGVLGPTRCGIAPGAGGPVGGGGRRHLWRSGLAAGGNMGSVGQARRRGFRRRLRAPSGLARIGLERRVRSCTSLRIGVDTSALKPRTQASTRARIDQRSAEGDRQPAIIRAPRGPLIECGESGAHAAEACPPGRTTSTAPPLARRGRIRLLPGRSPYCPSNRHDMRCAEIKEGGLMCWKITSPVVPAVTAMPDVHPATLMRSCRIGEDHDVDADRALGFGDAAYRIAAARRSSAIPRARTRAHTASPAGLSGRDRSCGDVPA